MAAPIWPTFTNVMDAYAACRIGKPASPHQTRFELRLGENILQLTREIQKRTYRPSRSVCFVVTHPKPREIFAAHFRDRVVHHLLVSRLTPSWERKFSPFSFACRKGRGTHGAINELRRQVRRISQGGRKTVYVLQLDLASFFVSIHRPTLRDLLLKHTRNEDLRWLIRANLDHDARKGTVIQSPPHLLALIPPEKSWFSRPPDDGLPIGNLTSQFGANVYLNDLDHWIVRTLKPQGYLRYMDDLTLFHTDPAVLEPMIEQVDDWLRTNRRHSLNSAKTSLNNLADGIEYLGYHITQDNTVANPARLRVPPKKKWDLIRDIRHLENAGIPAPERLHPLAAQVNVRKARTRLASINSRLGHLRHADSYHLRKAALSKLSRKMAFVDIDLGEDRKIYWEQLVVDRDSFSIKLR